MNQLGSAHRSTRALLKLEKLSLKKLGHLEGGLCA